MATIQKIRDNSALTLIVVGGALLAFILIDTVKPGNTSDTDANMVGAFEGDEISLEEYDAELKNTAYIYGQTTPFNDMTDQEKQNMAFQTWNVVMRDKLVNAECDLLGLGLTDEEQADMVSGEHVYPFYIYRLFGGPQTFNQNRAQIMSSEEAYLDHAYKQTQFGPQKMSAGEAEFIKNYGVRLRKQEKYMNLLKNCFYTTTSLAKDKYVAKTTSKSVKIGFVPYYLVPDSAVEVSESDIQAAYEEIKERFKKENESKKIVYAGFNLNYTREDEEQVRSWALETAELFKEETNDELFVKSESELPFDGKYYKQGEMVSKLLDTTLFDKKKGFVYGPYQEYKNGKSFWNVAKVIDAQMMADSLDLSQIVLTPSKFFEKAQAEGTQVTQELFNGFMEVFKKEVDSIQDLLEKNPSKFAEVAKAVSEDTASASKGGSLGWVGNTDAQYSKVLLDSAFLSEAGDVKMITQTLQQGIPYYTFIKVNKFGKKAKKLKVGVVSRSVEPGENTLNNLYNRANQVAIAVQNGKSIDALRDSLFYYVDSATVETFTYAVNDLQGSRDIVHWAFNGESDVAKVFTLKNKYIVAYAKAGEGDEYQPLSTPAVRLEAENLAKRKKKYEYVVAKLGAINADAITGLPNLFRGATVKVENNARADQPNGQFNGENKVVGAIAGLGKGQVSEPILGDQGVYLVLVESVNAAQITEDTNFVIEQNELKNANNKSEFVLREIIGDKSVVTDNRKVLH